MFNFYTPTSNQNSLPETSSPTKPLHNMSPAFFPTGPQPTWDPSSYFNSFQQDTDIKEEIPYNLKVLLENEEDRNSTSSDSEETDTMPDVSTTRFRPSVVKDWDFGQESEDRRRSETFLSSSPGTFRTARNSGIDTINNNGWQQAEPIGKVTAKPSYFAPLNLSLYGQAEKRAYFVTIEGFNLTNFRRFFRIERLCSSFQTKAPTAERGDGRPFLYIGLWNDSKFGHDGSENIFEPFIYAVPFLQYKLVVTVYMTHSNEDPYTFEFMVDLRHFALPTKESRTQGIEVVYTESENSTNPRNNITLHMQLTNEKLLVPHGFKNVQRHDGSNKQDQPLDYTVILREIMIGIPLYRLANRHPVMSPLIMHGLQQAHEINGKRGSATSLGQDRRSSGLENVPQSPMSWSNFTPDMSPKQKMSVNSQKFHQKVQQEDPILPPGIISNNMMSPFEAQNYAVATAQVTNTGTASAGPAGTGGNKSLFKFKGQQRFSMQPLKREVEEINSKRMNRIQSSDFSVLGDKNPIKIIEAYMNSNKTNTTTSLSKKDSTIGDLPTSIVGRSQRSISGIGSENEHHSQASSMVNVSSIPASMADIVPVEEEDSMKSNDGVQEEFRIEDYVGKMVDFAKTYQGSKVLEKHIATADKEDLDLIVNELGEKIGELMLDPYANYMLQTLVHNSSAKQRLFLFQKMAPWFLPIARDKKGTHSLQALVGQINTQEEYDLIKTIVGKSVVELSMDPRANYVIQKLINTVPIEKSQFIYQPLFDEFVQVANNSFGLLVLKQMMTHIENNEELRQKVVEIACLNFEKLIQDQYGNYAIQFIVENYPKESFLILNKILMKIIPYSSQKISSNVIEKCLSVCDAQFRRRVLEEILRNGRLGDLLKNKYGNFVTLQLLATTSPAEQQKLMQEIYRCANAFSGTKYKVRWLQFIQENPLKIKWSSNSNDNAINAAYEEGSHGEGAGRTLEKDQRHQHQQKLEAVKKIWRDMTKEEKNNNTPSFQYGKGGKKYYNKREDNWQ